VCYALDRYCCSPQRMVSPRGRRIVPNEVCRESKITGMKVGYQQWAPTSWPPPKPRRNLFKGTFFQLFIVSLSR
jgi:hypothetical protein